MRSVFYRWWMWANQGKTKWKWKQRDDNLPDMDSLTSFFSHPVSFSPDGYETRVTEVRRHDNIRPVTINSAIFTQLPSGLVSRSLGKREINQEIDWKGTKPGK